MSNAIAWYLAAAGFGLAMVFLLGWLKARKYAQIVGSRLGADFVKALTNHDGILILRQFTAGNDMDMFYVPYYRKDGAFYYIEFTDRNTGEPKRYHYAIKKKNTYNLHGNTTMAIVVEGSLSAITPEMLDYLTDLHPHDKARLINAFSSYIGLKRAKENLLKQMKRAKSEKEVEKIKKELEDIEAKMADIKAQWTTIEQVFDADTALIIPDKKNKTVTLIRQVDIEQLADFLESTSDEEIMNTARYLTLLFQTVVLEKMKKIVRPTLGTSARSARTWLLGFGFALFIIFVLLAIAR